MITKKIFLIFVFVFLVSLAPHAIAANDFTALAPIPGLTDSATVGSASGINANTLANFFNNLYKYLIGIAAVLAVIQIIWAGIEVATNRDNVSKLTEGKGKIMQAILGLVLVLSPAVVFSIINPSILNLSLNLPALDTKNASTTPATTTAVGTQAVNLSTVEQQMRQSAGGSVVFSFIISPSQATRITPIQLGQTLDTKQDECTAQTSGRGVILSSPPVGGGGFVFVCQTCAPNTTAEIYPKGRAGSGARGGCK